MVSGSRTEVILWTGHGRRKTAVHVWPRLCTLHPSFAFSPDGHRIAIQDRSNELITIRDTSLGSYLTALQIQPQLGVVNPPWPGGIVWSADGARIVAKFTHLRGLKAAQIWDAETYAPLYTISGIGHLLMQPGQHIPDSLFYCVIDAFSSNGRRVLGVRGKEPEEQRRLLFHAFEYVAVDIWLVTTGIRVWHSDTIPLEKPCVIQKATATLDTMGEKVAIWFSEDTIQLVRVVEGGGWLTLLHESEEKKPDWHHHRLLFSPIGELLLSWRSGGFLALWNTLSGQRITISRPLEETLVEPCFSPDGRYFAVTPRYTPIVEVYQAVDGSLLSSFEIPQPNAESRDGVTTLKFSNDGTHIWVGTGDGYIHALPIPTSTSNPSPHSPTP